SSRSASVSMSNTAMGSSQAMHGRLLPRPYQVLTTLVAPGSAPLLTLARIISTSGPILAAPILAARREMRYCFEGTSPRTLVLHSSRQVGATQGVRSRHPGPTLEALADVIRMETVDQKMRRDDSWGLGSASPAKGRFRLARRARKIRN